MAFGNPVGWILSISMCMPNFIKIFHTAQEIGPVSLFQNVDLRKVSTVEKIPWARSCPYPCVCKVLSKYPFWFNSNYGQFSQTDREHNKLIADTKTDHRQITTKLKEQEFSFVLVTHCLHS